MTARRVTAQIPSATALMLHQLRQQMMRVVILMAVVIQTARIIRTPHRLQIPHQTSRQQILLQHRLITIMVTTIVVMIWLLWRQDISVSPCQLLKAHAAVRTAVIMKMSRNPARPVIITMIRLRFPQLLMMMAMKLYPAYGKGE